MNSQNAIIALNTVVYLAILEAKYNFGICVVCGKAGVVINKDDACEQCEMEHQLWQEEQICLWEDTAGHM